MIEPPSSGEGEKFRTIWAAVDEAYSGAGGLSGGWAAVM